MDNRNGLDGRWKGVAVEIPAVVAITSAPVGGNTVEMVEWRETNPITNLIQWQDEETGFAGCRQAFARLKDASVSQIEAFARRWGVLGIEPLVTGNLKDLEADVTYREPVETWRTVARALDAVLRLASRLKQGKATTESISDLMYWQTVANTILYSNDPQAKAFMGTTDPNQPSDALKSMLHDMTPDRRRAWLYQAVDEWLDLTSCRPKLIQRDNLVTVGFGMNRANYRSSIVDWDFRRSEEQNPRFVGVPHPNQRPSALFTVLCLQLASAVGDAYECTNCGEVFTPDETESKRKPRIDKEGKFCSVVCSRESHLKYVNSRYVPRKGARA